MFTLEQAISESAFHFDGRQKRCYIYRRNGKTKLWKRQPGRFEIPVKYGLYSYARLTDKDASLLHCHAQTDCPYGNI